MVVKRQCSFCAQEIEPGTGAMFVKRDGTVFHFCSGSCRKQQLHLGRVGHRFKWTRAHALKKAADRSSAAARAQAPPSPVRKGGGRSRAPVAVKPSEPTPVPTPEAAATPAPEPETSTQAKKTSKPRAKAPKKSDAPSPKE
jgi:large subunit ribosomal protein L24e